MSERPELLHIPLDCTGNWRLVGAEEAKDRRLECERCGTSYEPTPENRLAAIDENYAGIYLRRLTAEGAAQIDREPKPEDEP